MALVRDTVGHDVASSSSILVIFIAHCMHLYDSFILVC